MGKRHSRLKSEVLEDLKQKTGFSEAEIKMCYKLFMNEFPSGQLSVEDLKKLYQRFCPLGDASMLAEYIFRSYDTDHNGQIDFQEFIFIQRICFRETVEQKLRWVFSIYDLDGDGYISRQDLLAMTTAVYRAQGPGMRKPEDESTPEKKTDKMFRQMDKDKDGKLSPEEFIEGAKNDPSIIQRLNALR